MGLKTNAARILDAAKINYEVVEYKVDDDDLSAGHVAELVGQPLEIIYKTLVLRGDKSGVLVACISGSSELDLKTLAAVSGNKKCEMVPLKDLLELTGYIRGGCSPIGMKKKYPIYLDTSMKKHEFIFISAGLRGKQLKIKPLDLYKITLGFFVDVILKA